jgi:hypothetical protein
MRSRPCYRPCKYCLQVRHMMKSDGMSIYQRSIVVLRTTGLFIRAKADHRVTASLSILSHPILHSFLTPSPDSMSQPPSSSGLFSYPHPHPLPSHPLLTLPCSAVPTLPFPWGRRTFGELKAEQPGRVDQHLAFPHSHTHPHTLTRMPYACKVLSAVASAVALSTGERGPLPHSGAENINNFRTNSWDVEKSQDSFSRPCLVELKGD